MKKPRKSKPKRTKNKSRKSSVQPRKPTFYPRRNGPWYNRFVGLIPIPYLALLLSVSPALLLSVAGYQKLDDQTFVDQIRWVKTTGKMVELDIVPAANLYVPITRYAYFVDGKNYVSGRRHFLRNCPVRLRSARSTVRRYSLGQDVPVYYAANNPAFAALNPFRRNPLAIGAMWFALSAFPLWLVALLATISFRSQMRSIRPVIRDFS